METDRHFDAIVIGSGIGGLTTAAILAKLRRQRVLVLERHYVPGGFTHEFKRPDGRKWDVGVHYVGDLKPGSRMRAIFDYISDGDLRWSRMPEPYDRYVYPDETFDVYGDPGTYREHLVARFPQERIAIEQYFRDLEAAEAWGQRDLVARALPASGRRVMRTFSRRAAALPLGRTQAYFDQRFSDPRLKDMLGARWRTHGLPPNESAFLAHAIIARHYMHGAYYPDGGASSIARTIIPVIERAGGQVLIRHEVTRLVMRDARVIGVEAIHKDRSETFFAPVVISDAGAHNTYGKLVPAALAAPACAWLRALPPSPTGATLYLSFKEHPSALGVRGENYWISDGRGHDRQRETEGVLAGTPPGCYLSFPSLKDPQAHRHTAEILALPDFEPFAPWADQSWRKRGGDYEAVKATISEGMLALVERHLPGFRALIDYQELSTPLSVEHFVASGRGAIYGLPTSPARFREEWLGVRTPVPNLYMTGADVYFLGVVGALAGGVAASAAITGFRGATELMIACTRLARETKRAA